MSKKVTFSPKPATVLPPNADAWVMGSSTDIKQESARGAPPPEKMKRFTFDVPESLHRRFKAGCAKKGVDMTVEIRRIMEERFPEP